MIREQVHLANSSPLSPLSQQPKFHNSDSIAIAVTASITSVKHFPYNKPLDRGQKLFCLVERPF